MKKVITGILALALCATAFFGCSKPNAGNGDDPSGDTGIVNPDGGNDNPSYGGENKPDDGNDKPTDGDEKPVEDKPINWLSPVSENERLSAGGYVKGNIRDFSVYEGTDAYRKVSTSSELIEALISAKYNYTSSWDEETQSVKQTLNGEGTVHVIEITADLDMGYNLIDAKYKANRTYVEDYCRKKETNFTKFTMSDMFTQSGISLIKIENTNDLLIYSKNGAKITHGGFSILSCDNVVIRNIAMDEMWQWEDSSSKSTGAVGDYDAFGWAYVKVAHSRYVWIDHCTFGKSYDGQIDYSNPVYNTKSTAFRAPYGADGSNGLHISWCNFTSGSDYKDGYLYKMMAKIEEDYQGGGANYLYYKALRDGGLSFEQILYGVAIPQKKGFLCGDSGNKHSEYDNNLKLLISFANCKFTDLEDRLPKLRGGNAVMYDCVVDSSRYYSYRTALMNKNCRSLVARVNSTWKCALVSQGIVCGNGGSVYAKNCIFKGIQSLLKNNDEGGLSEVYADDNKTVIGTTSRPKDGGYKIENCSYRLGETVSTTNFPNSSATILKTENFIWRTKDGNQPFEIAQKSLETVGAELADEKYGAGIKK